MTCRQFIVTGRVQGVFFRASTREVAVPLGLTGHAINLPDGSVEILACGDEPALQELEHWLAAGPRLARVESVQRKDIDCPAPVEFSVG